MTAISGVSLLGLCVSATAREPMFRAVVVAPSVVEPKPLEGVPSDAAQPERVRFLEKRVTEHIDHWLLEHCWAGAVTRLALGTSQLPVLAGTVRLPICLPSDLSSRRKSFYSEDFATAQIMMRLPNGTKVEAEATLDGKDIHLGKRLRQQLTYNSGINWVLEVYAEKVVDRALERLLQKISPQPA